MKPETASIAHLPIFICTTAACHHFGVTTKWLNDNASKAAHDRYKSGESSTPPLGIYSGDAKWKTAEVLAARNSIRLQPV